MAEFYRQFAFVSSVLAGFAFTFYGTLLVAEREHRAGAWAAFLAVAASVAFRCAQTVFACGVRSMSTSNQSLQPTRSLALRVDVDFEQGIRNYSAASLPEWWLSSRQASPAHPPVNESKDIRLEVTDGFYLSPIVRADKAAYLEHFADPEIAQSLLAIPFPYTEADADCWLDHCEQFIGSPMTNFALRAPSGYLIGAIGVVGVLSTDAHSAEFGYWLAQSYRGHGLMPRVIRTFSDYAFRQLRIHRLFATPFSSNLASHRALEKAGFQREGLLRHHHFKQGIYLDAIVYGRISDSNGNA